jgi:hypothetical protein
VGCGLEFPLHTQLHGTSHLTPKMTCSGRFVAG